MFGQRQDFFSNLLRPAFLVCAATRTRIFTFSSSSGIRTMRLPTVVVHCRDVRWGFKLFAFLLRVLNCSLDWTIVWYTERRSDQCYQYELVAKLRNLFRRSYSPSSKYFSPYVAFSFNLFYNESNPLSLNAHRINSDTVRRAISRFCHNVSYM